MTRRTLALAGLLAMPACASIGPRSVKTPRLRGPYRILVYKGPRPDYEGEIAPGSAEERAISGWLLAHESGWRTDLNTYVPGRQVEGQDFRLDFHPRLAVLNYDADGKGNWWQASLAIEEGDIPDVFARAAGTVDEGKR